MKSHMGIVQGNSTGHASLTQTHASGVEGLRGAWQAVLGRGSVAWGGHGGGDQESEYRHFMQSDRHMERVIWKGYRLEELLEFFRGRMGEGEALRNSGRFLNKRNLRRVGEIMRNANLTQGFSFYLLGFSPACLYMFLIHRDQRRPPEPCASLHERS